MNKETNTYHLLASAESIRIFWGYKQDGVTQEDFNKDLGETFMPGTPAVLAPLGLNGYLPAVLGHDKGDRYPDEVALIVYPSLELYDAARSNNLLGRIYTYSHAGVFDTARSRGQWPGTVENPVQHPSIERWAWRVFDNHLDWQKGDSRLVAMESNQVDLYQWLLEFSTDKKDRLKELGVDELIIQCTKTFATLWFQSNSMELDFSIEDLISESSINVVNDIKANTFIMRHGSETLDIKGESYIRFHFPRELKYYI